MTKRMGYRFFFLFGRQFGVSTKPFRWIYIHGGSNVKAGGLRVGFWELIW